MGLPTISSLFVLVRTCGLSRYGVLRLWIRIYYMFANMASLNNWRRMRGFSEPIQLEVINLYLTRYQRYICFSPSLRRSWRYRPPDVGLPHIALYISRNLATQGPCPSISVLPQANRNCDEPFEQQCVVFDIRKKPVAWFLQDRVECQFKHRRPTPVPLHQGRALINSRSSLANKGIQEPLLEEYSVAAHVCWIMFSITAS